MSSEGPPHEASQSGHVGGRGINNGASRQDHSGGGGAGLHDGSTVKDNSFIKAHIIDRGVSSLLKTELILGSHRVCNWSVMRASLLITLGEPVH